MSNKMSEKEKEGGVYPPPVGFTQHKTRKRQFRMCKNQGVLQDRILRKNHEIMRFERDPEGFFNKKEGMLPKRILTNFVDFPEEEVFNEQKGSEIIQV